MEAKPCRAGEHALTEVFRADSDWNGDAVVRWCPYCGGVVVDLEVDGRRMRALVPMQFPEFVKKNWAALEGRKP